MRRIRARLKAARLMLARRWAMEHGLVLARPDALATARLKSDAVWHYTLRSGHLTRAFHAGHVLRVGHAAIMDALDSVQA